VAALFVVASQEPWVVEDDEWCSQAEASSMLDSARAGASTAVSWKRLLPVLNESGTVGYYRPAVQNEVEWQSRSHLPKRLARRVGRGFATLIEFIAEMI
jgi:hypothetical protein